MKKKSEQAIRDEKRAEVIQNENSSAREKEKAFSELFNEHNKQLKVFFMQRTKADENTSDELLMETFTKAYKYFENYDSKFAFSTWLYKIATNTLIDHTRKVKMEVFSLEDMTGKHSEDADGLEFQISSDSLDPQEAMSNTALGQEIKDAIYDLPNKFVRDVMVDLYINELSFEEITNKMGLDKRCSTPRVGARRGRKALAKKLAHLENFAR